MLRVDVLQNRLLILTVLGGIAVLLAVILFFIALWRPRVEQETGIGERPPGKPRAGAWMRSYIPWLAIIGAIATLLFALAYTAGVIRKPPSW